MSGRVWFHDWGLAIGGRYLMDADEPGLNAPPDYS
jgi:hypothetical protein